MIDKCRACLRTTAVFDWNIIAFDNLTFSEVYWDFTKLKRDNNKMMPQCLCFTCGPALKSSYDFLQQALENDKVLRSQALDFENFEVVLIDDAVKKSVKSQISDASNEDEVSDAVDAVKTKKQLTGKKKVTVLKGKVTNTIESKADESINADVIKNDTPDLRGNPEVQNVVDDDETIFQDLIEVMACSDDDDDSKVQSETTEEKPTENIGLIEEMSFDTDEWRQYLKDADANISKLDGAPPMLICKLCLKCFSKEVKFKTHLKTHFTVVSSPAHVCNNCSKVFRSKHTMEVHIARVHRNVSEPKYLCDKCPKAYQKNAALHHHKQTEHSNSLERKYVCNICGWKFHKAYIAANHMRTHEAKREKRLKCDYCSKLFYTIAHKKRHMNLHTGNFVQCEICGHRCSHQSLLNNHIKRHQAASSLKCHHCDKMFRFPYELVAHIRFINGVIFKCDVCSMEYDDRRKLRVHRMKEHFGYPRECSICKKTFINISKARLHLRRIHGITDKREAEKAVIKREIKPYSLSRLTPEEFKHILQTQTMPNSK